MNTNTYRMSGSQRKKMWDCWRQGMSHRMIGEQVGISAPSVFLYLQKYGGIEPAARVRREGSLSLDEREEISRSLAAGHSIRAIARSLDRHASSISREIQRNGGRRRYRALRADRAAWNRAKRPKVCRLAHNGRLRQRVSSLLAKDWSPQQISGWLAEHYPGNGAMQISHETIYKSLFIQSRGVLNKELKAHLRTARNFRQARTKTRKHVDRVQIPDGISISERPADVEDRAVPGHWEGDLIAGDQKSFIATLVERKTRFVMLVKVPNKQTDEVVKALARQMKRLPTILKNSLTWDRGLEMSNHKQFKFDTDIDVYFCDPYSPWQRGSNENTNGLLRQYFPKGKSVAHFTQAQLNAVAKKLNTRPRKTLGYSTPAQELAKVLH